MTELEGQMDIFDHIDEPLPPFYVSAPGAQTQCGYCRKTESQVSIQYLWGICHEGSYVYGLICQSCAPEHPPRVDAAQFRFNATTRQEWRAP